MFLTLLMALLFLQPLYAANPLQTNLVQGEETMPGTLTLAQAELVVQSGQVAHASADEVPAIDPAQDEVIPAVKSAQIKEKNTDKGQQACAEPVKVAQPIKLEPEKKETKQEAVGIIKIVDKIQQTEEIINKIIDFSDDSNIKGILLIIDCGGGAMGSSEILFREIKVLSCQKPVVALVINGCCSGAYFVAVACDWIVAQASSTVGSIGVKYTVEKCKNYTQTDPTYTADLDITVFCAGKFKGACDARTAVMNEEERAAAQNYVDRLYEIFTSFVAQARNLSLEKVSEWAEGKDFTGAQALKLGLIDQIGGYSDAVKKLEQLIKDRGIVVTQKLTFVE